MSIWDIHEAVEDLRKYYDDPAMSNEHIARTLFSDYGIEVSKNAVIGKAKRLGLVKVKTNTRYNRSFAFQKPKPKRKKRFVKGDGKPKPPTGTFLQRPHKIGSMPHDAVISLRPDQCRWPIGDLYSQSFKFCENTKFPGRSYCRHHLGK